MSCLHTAGRHYKLVYYKLVYLVLLDDLRRSCSDVLGVDAGCHLKINMMTPPLETALLLVASKVLGAQDTS